eukprot:365787-Chlamydomonas_euryale.AAC.3
MAGSNAGSNRKTRLARTRVRPAACKSGVTRCGGRGSASRGVHVDMHSRPTSPRCTLQGGRKVTVRLDARDARRAAGCAPPVLCFMDLLFRMMHSGWMHECMYALAAQRGQGVKYFHTCTPVSAG